MPNSMDPLPVDAVRYHADLSSLGVNTSDDLAPAPAIVGQGPALEALAVGLNVGARGYNVFLTGSKGTGRFAAVRQTIGLADLECPLSSSQTYVHDFKRQDRPLLITLPRGMGREFQAAVDELRSALGEEVPALLGSEVLTKSRQRLLDKFDRESKRLFAGFEERVGDAGFTLAQSETATGTIRMADIFPVIGGDPVPMEQLEADPAEAGVDEARLSEMQTQRSQFKGELASLVYKHRQLSSRYQGLVRDSERRKVDEAIEPLFNAVVEKFGPHDDDVATWIAGMREELSDNLDLFRAPPSSEDQSAPGPSMEGFLWFARTNLLWDPAQDEDQSPAPVVEESWPTWRNIFGTIEAGGDPPLPTFVDVRAGALVRANGGFLVLYAADVLRERGVYDNLKRVIRKGELEISAQSDGHHPAIALKPAPIPLQVKVVLVGERHDYDMLHMADPHFPAIFKIKVEFDYDMPRTPNNERAFLSVLKRIIDSEKLPTFDAGALGALLEEAVRLAGHRDHVTTRFSNLANLMREAAHVAKIEGADTVTGEHQTTAISQRLARHDLLERKMLDMIKDAKVLIDVDGHQVGQINGLGYYDTDDAQFGMPARISATCSAGRSGVVNIEREADLSGRIHDKGVLILSGFLGSTFAQDKPLSLHAHVAFEQSYAMVDGDSASLAELLALLSSLSAIPLRQDVAVTGSLNQFGQVQPVGGVTEKTQGFFRACRIKGLTGTQGVMLPAVNVPDLHLATDVRDAVAEGRFSIWPATDVRGALEFMTGRSADEVLLACDQTLKRYAETVRDYK